jgi:hypothetical protein
VEFTNGTQALFVVDTGSPVTVLDKSLEAELGKRYASVKLKFPILGSDDKAWWYAAPEMSLGKFKLKTAPYVVCGDLSAQLKKEIPDRKVAGILGLDCFEKEIVRFDFANGRICFMEPGTKADRDWGRAYPMQLKVRKGFWRKWRTVEATAKLDVSGKDLSLRVDSGYLSDGMLDGRAMDWAMRSSLRGYQTGRAAETKNMGALFPKIDFGGETYTNIVLANTGRNLLGLGFLARNEVTFDFPAGVMYLKRSEGR